MAKKRKQKSQRTRPNNHPNPPATKTAAKAPLAPCNLNLEPAPAPTPAPEPCNLPLAPASLVPYDENLLERARTQWQFGDWQSLAELGTEQNSTPRLQHHPDRAKLALLAAAGHMQCGSMDQARRYVRLARDWGCDKKLVSRILIAGVHNSLGRAAAVAGKQAKALDHFERAVAIGTPGGDTRLLVQGRAGEQLHQLGFQGANAALEHLNGKQVTAPSLSLLKNQLFTSQQKIKEEIKSEVQADIKANNPNPYAHNRTLTPAFNKTLRDFASINLKKEGIKAAYIDYLAAKSIQIERNCVGRLATTVQDAIARQLVAESVSGKELCILEIGALYGVSLAILYNHAITRFDKVQVVCLDPFDGYYGKAMDAVLNQPVNDLTFIRNMELANVPQADYRVLKHYSTDPVALNTAKELPINLLIIDGDHSYEGVKFDFDNYFPLLAPGGYVVFDDYNAKEWPGVQKFIDEDLRKSPDLEYVGAISRTAVARKKSVALT
ncbi:class I SAM-dependent methyltransferase [Desulfurivibrio dismutans]|uniref:class I SAM-dependent methyltransferase n=1 Tax=Desulfurivibrio dismutans TaxID=1398908 RepID=UPI0023DA95AD|nr:class I SAM-dependent methyltransferase [Desulfurivibrio alkaliphilus]MDF1615678.1 class I SAM-dependent methyltransferase [Desulfurivibrio alkaliphilus]